jgi:hypothetical protein
MECIRSKEKRGENRSTREKRKESECNIERKKKIVAQKLKQTAIVMVSPLSGHVRSIEDNEAFTCLYAVK